MELLTIPEAARRCRLGKSTLYEMLSKGEGPVCTRIGTRVFVMSADLEKWIWNCREQRAVAA